MPDDKEPIDKFAARIKQKYPEYKDVNDTLLVQKIVAKYPEYEAQVDLAPLKKKETSGGITSSLSQSQSGEGLFTGKGIQGTLRKPEMAIETAPSAPKDIADPVGHLINEPEKKFNEGLNTINTFGVQGRNISESTQPNLKPQFNKDRKSSQVVVQEEFDKAQKDYNDALWKADKFFFQDGKEAGEYVNKMVSEHNVDDIKDNRTVQLAFDKYQKYEGLKKRIAETPDIRQLAVNIAREADPNLDKQILVLEGGKEDDRGLDRYENVLPQAVQGRMVDELLHQKDLAAIAKENPNVKAQLDQLQNGGVYLAYPDYGEVVARNMISREYQKRKANLVANAIFNKSEYLDKLSDEIFADNPALKKIADERLKGKWEGKVDTSGLVDEFGTGAKKTFQQMGESFKDFIGAGKTEMERTEEGLKNQYEGVSSGVGGWRAKLGHAANFAGMLTAMAAAGAPLRGAGLSPKAVNTLVTANTFFDEELKTATLKHPGESWKQYLEAATMTGLYLAAGNALPSSKIASVLEKAKPEVTEALKNLSADAVESEVKNSLVNAVQKSLTGTLKGTGEMVALTAINKGLDEYLGMNGQASQKYHPDNEIADVAEGMLVGLAGPNIISSFRNRRAVANSLYSIADNSQRYLDVLEQRAEHSPSFKEELEKQRENINFLAETKSELALLDISEPNKKRFLLEAMNEKFRRDKIAQSPESSLTRRQHNQVRESMEMQDRILKGEDVAGEEAAKEFSPEEQKAIDAIKNKDLSGTALEIYGKILSDENIAPDQKKMALREISDQLLAEGTAETTGSALGKDASLAIEALGHEAPKESEGVQNIPASHVPAIEESAVAVTQPKRTGAESTSDGGVTVIKPVADQKSTSVIMPGENKAPDIVPLKTANESQVAEGDIKPTEQIPAKEEGGAIAEPPEVIPPAEEPAAPPESAKPVWGVTHAAVADARKKAGLPEYEGHTPVTHEERLAKARTDMEANPKLAEDTMDYVEKGGRLEPQDNAVLAVYKGRLDKELESSPSKETYDKVSRLAKVLDPEGTFAGQLLESRKLISNEDNLANFLLEKEASQGVKLSDKQVKEETEKYTELKKAKEALAELEKADKESYAKLVAELGVNKAKAARNKAAKKTHDEYKADRKATIEAAKEALKKLRGEASATIVPGAKELTALTPHVKEYMRSLVNEGIDKLDNIVNDIHAEFKDVLDGLRKSDIINIIAGQHDEVKAQTKNEKANALRTLKREAQLINEIAAERKGEMEAKTDEKKRDKSRRIIDLEKKLKEVKELNKKLEPEVDDTLPFEFSEEEVSQQKEQEKLKRRIDKLEDDLKTGKFLEEKEKPKPIKLSRETIKLKDKVIELEDKIRLERQKDEYSKRNKWLRRWDKVMQVLGVRRIVQTAIDLSIPFRQGATLISPVDVYMKGKSLSSVRVRLGNITTWVKSFGNMLKSVFNPKRYARLMYDIRHSDDYHDMTKDGIVFNELDAFKPEDRNEDYQKSFIYHIPVVSEPLKASNRAADAFLNTARYEMYMKLKDNLESQGLTRQSDPEAYKFAANWAMNMTGRGKMIDALENPLARQILGNTFFGARLMASRFNLLNPVTYFDRDIPKEVRYQAMKDMAGFTATIMASGLALAATGAKISMNPWDSDFLQVRYGDKVYDISGGLVNYVRTFLRMVSAGYTKFTGTKYQGSKATEKAGMSILNFFRNKLSPNTSYATDAFFGAAYPREFDPYGIAKIYPMYADDAIKAAKEDGVISLLTVLLPNLLGVGYGNYATKGQIDKDEKTLLDRNMRSDEMDNEKIKNYRDGGRDITAAEFDEFATLRDEEIRKGVEDLFNNGAFHKKYKDLTKEEVVKITNKIKAAATKKIKHKLFGDKRSNGYKNGVKRS